MVIQCLKNRSLYSANSGTPWGCKQHKWTKPLNVFIPTCLQVSLHNSSSVHYSALNTKKLVSAMCSFIVNGFVDKSHHVCLTYRTYPRTEQPLLDHLYITCSYKILGKPSPDKQKFNIFITWIPPSKKSLLS